MKPKTAALYFQIASFFDPDLIKVLVFKTSLKTREDIKKIAPHLESLPGLRDWSVDNNDCDNVLRITGSNLQTKKVIALLTKKGFKCKKLP